MKAYKFLLKGYKAMLCESGFHASKEIRGAVRYCSGSHLVEVELSGDIVDGGDKIVASEITILRELDLPRELETLAGDEDWWVRYRVAYNHSTLAGALKALAGDKNSDVRLAVTRNPNTSVETLKTLAGNEDNGVRRAVAWNPNTPIETLRTLAGDEHSWVRRAVAENPYWS